MLGVDDVRHSLVVRRKSIGVGFFHFLHALDAFSIRVLPPGDHGLLEEIHLDKSIEVVHLSASIFIKVVFSSNESDSLENFHSECLTSNGTDDIYSIFLLSYVVSPDEQNVSSFIDIVIVTNSSGHGVERLLKIFIELLGESRLLLNFLRQFFRFSRMVSLLLFSLLLQISSLLFLLLEFSSKLLLPQFEGGLSPSSESSTDGSPVPIEHDFS